MFSKKQRRHTVVDTLVGASTKLNGDLTFEGGCHIDGTVEGSVSADAGSNSALSVSEDGTITALAAGDATVEAKIPGLAARSGFLFIKALGQVGFYADGAINWDIAILVGGFGLTLFLSQLLSGMGMPANPQQATANKITPVMITGMFLFFPLPAGVLLYMVIANIFQAGQTFLLTREALPDNLQSILNDQLKQQSVASAAAGNAQGGSRLPFEPRGGNK